MGHKKCGTGKDKMLLNKLTAAKLASCCSNRCCLPLSSKTFQRLQFNSANNCLSTQEAVQQKIEDKMLPIQMDLKHIPNTAPANLATQQTFLDNRASSFYCQRISFFQPFHSRTRLHIICTYTYNTKCVCNKYTVRV